MGTIKKGILGGFSGRIGSVVGTCWKGIDVVKAMPVSVANPRSAGQMEQRLAMKQINAFLKDVGVSGIRILNNPSSMRMSGWNRCVKKVVRFKPGNELSGHLKCIAGGSFIAPVGFNHAFQHQSGNKHVAFKSSEIGNIDVYPVGTTFAVTASDSLGLRAARLEFSDLSGASVDIDCTEWWDGDSKIFIGVVAIAPDGKSTSDVSVIEFKPA